MKPASRFVVCLALLLPAAVLSGCMASGYALHKGRQQARILPATPDGATGIGAWYSRTRLDLDLKRLRTYDAELRSLSEELAVLQTALTRKSAEAFNEGDDEGLDSVLFRFLACRESLWDIVSYYGEPTDFTGSPREIEGFLIGFCAALTVQYNDARLVAAFMGAPAAIDRLNMAHPEADIPGGTYGKLLAEVTSIDNLEAQEAAWKLFSDEVENPDSSLARLVAAQPECGALVENIKTLRLYAEAQTQRLLDRRAVLFPGAQSKLVRARILDRAKQSQETSHSGLGGARALHAKGLTAMIASAVSYSVKVTHDQALFIKSLMQPGDVLCVYWSGHLSNLFIPGTFKHALTYIGQPRERENLGCADLGRRGATGERLGEVKKDVFVRVPDLAHADVIEAVGDGVIFNSIVDILESHINRMVVLRPKLSPADRYAQLEHTFLFLGRPYDLKFDFGDDSRLCCSEVPYWCLQGRGAIRFTLVRHLGLLTLSPDDIIRQSLSGDRSALDVILVLDEDPASSDHAALILAGSEGERHLRKAMGP